MVFKTSVIWEVRSCWRLVFRLVRLLVNSLQRFLISVFMSLVALLVMSLLIWLQISCAVMATMGAEFGEVECGLRSPCWVYFGLGLDSAEYLSVAKTRVWLVLLQFLWRGDLFHLLV